ncbi:hypothetical protein EWM64_g9820 [Hericium alpestre]|uniref:Uncharacterized protein n=1 Tax=Hericium alpestre TaxID=135208 RepID=A0A4Y9ZHS9_9AGAM|nr:hypothetical protein EWM64_g9820 [Hericium alpestre]
MANTSPQTRAASPAELTTDTTLAHLPATIDAHADMTVAIATQQMHTAHICSEPHKPPLMVNNCTTPCPPFPVLSTPANMALASLMPAIDLVELPDLFYASPVPVLDHYNLWFTTSEALPPSTIMRLAKSIDKIDKALLEEIREEGRREERGKERIEEHQQQRAWKDGYEQGR